MNATEKRRLRMAEEDAAIEAKGITAVFAAVLDRERAGFTLGVCKRGEKGYHHYNRAACWPTFEEAQEVAMQLNEKMGLTRREAAIIIASTMGGAS